MTWRHALLLTVISIASVAGPSAPTRAQDEPPKKPKPGSDVSVCAKVTASASYQGYGYTHLVELKNTCDKPVQCRVWTNVDAAKITLTAAPGQSASAATRKGSPSRDVTAFSECTFAK